MSDWHICRGCGKVSFHAGDEMVRTGPRHWYHFACYLDAGKPLSHLSPHTVGRMPYRILKDHGLLAEAEAIAARDD